MQVVYSSQQRQTISASNPNLKYMPSRSNENALHHSPMESRDPGQTRYAPQIFSSDSPRLVEYPQPRKRREVQYIDAHDKRPYQRHHSEGVLPSVEVDEFDSKDLVYASQQDAYQYKSNHPNAKKVHGLSQRPLQSAGELYDRQDHPISKRARDDGQVYMNDERPNRSALPDDRGRIVVLNSDRNVHNEKFQRLPTNPTYGRAPVVVNYDSSTVRLPAQAAEEQAKPERQVYPGFPLRHDKSGQPLGVVYGNENVVPRENRRASYTQPAQRIWPESYPPTDASSSPYFTAPKRVPTFVSPSTHMIRKDIANEDRIAAHAEAPSYDGQYYDTASRVVRYEPLPRLDNVIYVPSRGAIESSSQRP